MEVRISLRSHDVHAADECGDHQRQGKAHSTSPFHHIVPQSRQAVSGVMKRILVVYSCLPLGCGIETKAESQMRGLTSMVWDTNMHARAATVTVY